MAGIIDPPERKPKIYAERKDLLEGLDDDAIYKRYRFPRAGIERIVDMIRSVADETKTERGKPVDLMTQVASMKFSD